MDKKKKTILKKAVRSCKKDGKGGPLQNSFPMPKASRSIPMAPLKTSIPLRTLMPSLKTSMPIPPMPKFAPDPIDEATPFASRMRNEARNAPFMKKARIAQITNGKYGLSI